MKSKIITEHSEQKTSESYICTDTCIHMEKECHVTNLSNKTWERGRHVIQNIQVRHMIRYYYTGSPRLFRLRFVFLVKHEAEKTN